MHAAAQRVDYIFDDRAGATLHSLPAKTPGRQIFDHPGGKIVRCGRSSSHLGMQIIKNAEGRTHKTYNPRIHTYTSTHTTITHMSTHTQTQLECIT